MNRNAAGAPGHRPDQRRERFEALYSDYHGPVFGYVLRRTDNAEDAADAIADTFLIAWRRLDDIPTGDQARLWLYGVARRVLANQRRGERRRSTLADRLAAEIIVPHGPLESTGDLAPVAAAFGRLRQSDREILALEGWEGLTPAQIATVLDCSRNAARIRLHRARRRLTAQLADDPTVPRPAAANVLPGEPT